MMPLNIEFLDIFEPISQADPQLVSLEKRERMVQTTMLESHHTSSAATLRSLFICMVVLQNLELVAQALQSVALKRLATLCHVLFSLHLRCRKVSPCSQDRGSVPGQAAYHAVAGYTEASQLDTL